MIMGKIVFLNWEQLFGTASISQLGKLKLAIHSSIKLRINILKVLKIERMISIINNYYSDIKYYGLLLL